MRNLIREQDEVRVVATTTNGEFVASLTTSGFYGIMDCIRTIDHVRNLNARYEYDQLRYEITNLTNQTYGWYRKTISGNYKNID